VQKLSRSISTYQQQLREGEIRVAYEALVKFVMSLRTRFSKSSAEAYAFTGILHGYLDYTYFYYSNPALRSRKLKLGFVLDHLEMRFQIWLLGNTKPVQLQYWERLSNSKWNRDREDMPVFSILEATIMEAPDFDDLPALADALERRMLSESKAIEDAVVSVG